jgi:hypothetical protein
VSTRTFAGLMSWRSHPRAGSLCAEVSSFPMIRRASFQRLTTRVVERQRHAVVVAGERDRPRRSGSIKFGLERIFFFEPLEEAERQRSPTGASPQAPHLSGKKKSGFLYRHTISMFGFEAGNDALRPGVGKEPSRILSGAPSDVRKVARKPDLLARSLAYKKCCHRFQPLFLLRAEQGVRTGRRG